MSTPPPVMPPPSPMPPQAGGVPVPNYMVWSIIITVVSLCLCCVIGTIPGIVAIVFSSKVNGALDRGDFAEAKRSSDAAKLWCWITTGLCALGLLINIGMMATGGMARYTERLQQIEHMQGR
ncbi:CD225/dispanin family protein [Lysobacter sp. TY2-98]|nr:CD225/dispanin family protein [Lysobacter sp. TY2-98]